MIGGVVGGYSAYKQGNNIWTGKHNRLTPKIELEYEELDELTPQNSHFEDNQVDILRETNKEIPTSTKYDVFYNNNELSQYTPERGTIKINRPTIKGYNELQLSKPGHQDLYHNFPRAIDNIVIQHGNVYPPTNGGTMYTLPGYINGSAGVYSIKINSMGIIYHRQFVPLEKINSIY